MSKSVLILILIVLIVDTWYCHMIIRVVAEQLSDLRPFSSQESFLNGESSPALNGVPKKCPKKYLSGILSQLLVSPSVFTLFLPFPFFLRFFSFLFSNSREFTTIAFVEKLWQLKLAIPTFIETFQWRVTMLEPGLQTVVEKLTKAEKVTDKHHQRPDSSHNWEGVQGSWSSWSLSWQSPQSWSSWSLPWPWWSTTILYNIHYHYDHHNHHHNQEGVLGRHLDHNHIQEGVLGGHPDLAGKLADASLLTPESTRSSLADDFWGTKKPSDDCESIRFRWDMTKIWENPFRQNVLFRCTRFSWFEVVSDLTQNGPFLGSPIT